MPKKESAGLIGLAETPHSVPDARSLGGIRLFGVIACIWENNSLEI